MPACEKPPARRADAYSCSNLFDLFCQILTNSDKDLVVNTGATGANGALLVKKWGTNPKMAERKKCS